MAPLILAQGADFYLHPAIHPDGKLLAWVEWDHPNMPWDGARLMLMSLMAEDQDYFQAKQTAGDESQAVFQPIFSPDGNKLAWLQNTGEFDDLIVMDLSSGEQTTLLEDRNLLPPAWVQGGRVLAWSADSSEIFFFENEFGTVSLNKVNVFSKQEEKIDTQPYTLLEQLSLSPQGQIAMIAQSPALAPRIIVKSGAETKVVMRSQADTLGQAEFARPERVSWASSDGVQVHGLYYPPTNTRFTNDSAPPMVTAIHGGDLLLRSTTLSTWMELSSPVGATHILRSIIAAVPVTAEAIGTRSKAIGAIWICRTRSKAARRWSTAVWQTQGN